MKKFLAMLLALVMVLGLCACGGKDDDKSNDSNPPAGTADNQTPSTDNQTPDNSASAPSADPNDITSWILEDNPESITGTVRFWIPFKGTQGMDDMIADFNKIYPNVTVELTVYNNNSDGNMGVNAAIMAEEIDVLASFGLPNTYRRWENGMFEDLTDKIAEEGIDIAANWGTDVYNYNGTYYTFPCGGLSYYVAINMDKWNAAGLGDLPTEWTWDEYLEACRKMTEVAADGTVTCYGGSLNHSINDYMLAQYQVTGKDMYYNAETGMSSFNDPVNVNALQREYDAESYPVDWITGFAPYPVEEKGQTNYCSGVGYFSHAGVITTAQDKDAAWAFCKYYATYGCKYLIAAGHAPTWKGTEVGSTVEVAFGSQEKAETLVDVESFVRCFANPANPGYADTQTIASTDLGSIVSEYALAVMRGDYSVEEGSQIMQEKGDEAINAAK